MFAARGAAGYALAGSDSAGSRAAQARASNPEQPADQVGPSPVGQANPDQNYRLVAQACYGRGPPGTVLTSELARVMA